jgi:hypothetical protein
MKKTLTILVSVLLLIACNSETKNSKDTAEDIAVIALTDIESSADQMKEKAISVSGMVTHVCKHGGQKMFITDSSGDISLKVVVTESIPEFDIALEGSNVEVTGKLVIAVLEQEGEGHEEGMENAEKEECETEADSSGQEDACAASITYHLEATSFKEIL